MGKMASKLLADVGFIRDNADATGAMLRKKFDNSLYT
jgi:hypothetical protein